MTTVAKVKTRSGVTQADTSQDELLTFLITEVAHRFESFLGRALHRAVGCVDEFAGDAKFLQLAAAPVESVQAWELLDDEASGWVAAAAPRYQVWGKGRSILLLLDPVGTAEQRLRVTYTAGYVYQDEVPGAGQVRLPDWVEEACVTQVAHLWQIKDKINVSRVEVSSGIHWTLADYTWVSHVRQELAEHQRNTYLGHS